MHEHSYQSTKQAAGSVILVTAVSRLLLKAPKTPNRAALIKKQQAAT